ncbi:hypothetical protein HKD37_18G050293 [Glycine soja]
MASNKRKAPVTPSQVRYDRSRFTLLRPDPQELAAKLYIPGRGYELNTNGLPLKILRKNLTTIAHTWSLLSFSNLVPTSHTSDITLDMAKLIYEIIQRMDMNMGYLISHRISMIAQHDSSRLGFLALITALCKARGVTFDSKTLESLSPAINLAYVKKNCWNLDVPTVTFRGPRKAKGKKSETLPSSEFPTTTSTPSTSAPISSTPATSAPSLAQLPVLAPSSSGPSNFCGLAKSPAFSFWRGETSTTQEPELAEEHTPAVEDELTSLEPFSFVSDSVVAQEEVPSPELILEPSPAPISEDTLPSTPALEQEQPISQDPPTAPMLDLNEHAEDHPQED